MFRLIPRHLLLVVRELLQRALYRDAWHLLVNLNKDQPLNFREAVIVMPPKDRFWADPHVLQKNSSFFIFIEEYLYKNKSGHIAVIEMDSQGNWGSPIRVLEKDYHLSYPFVFEHENRVYMIPESAQHRTIELYECVRFPDKWQFKMNLMENIRAVDTTLFCYRDKWWLFTAITENEAAFPQTELFLYYAPDPLTTNWNPHPMNPIVSDVKNARPAGRIFIKDQKIFRPSQKCSGKYGYSFDLNEITCLSEREYAEKKVLSVEPRWDKHIQATHTLASQGQLTVIDALVKRRKFF